MSEEQEVSGEEVQAAAAPENEVVTQESEQERQVPLAALESERAKRQSMEQENQLMKDHLELMRANQRPQAPQTPQSDYGDLADDDVMTVADFKKISSKMTNQLNSTMEEMNMSRKYPDYQDVITKHLPELLKTNPGLRNSLQKTQDYELAYHLAKTSDSYRGSTQTKKQNEDAARIIKNSQTTGSISSVGASTPMGQAKRYKDMSDSDFREVMRRNQG
jgi:hypothetical protein